MSLGENRLEALELAATLTNLEKNILVRLTDGYSDQSLGENLYVNAQEVEQARKSLFEKIGATRTADAVRIGLQLARHDLLELT